MNDAENLTEEHCPECGAPVGAVEQRCWLCDRSRSSAWTSSLPGPRTAPRLVGRGSSFSLETLMMFTTVVAVGMGAIVSFPGIGILFAILLAPAFVRTALAVRRLEKNDRPVHSWQRVVMFLGSFFTALTIVVLVSATSLGAFFALAFAACWSNSSRGHEIMLLVSFCSLLAILVSIVFAVVWIRYRWRRDMPKPMEPPLIGRRRGRK